jgi:DNA-binding MarR family transcriptional regulator
MIEILTRLERRELVVREPDAHHARILRAELTKRGRELLRDADRAVAGLQEQILADVPQRERAILVEGMRAVMNRLSGGL